MFGLPRTYSTGHYSTSLTNREWEIVEPIIPGPKFGGASRRADIRAILDAIFYLNKTGCQWRLLPQDFPPWPTVYGYFRRWRDDGTWEEIHAELRAQVRHEAGKDEEATAAIIDSQSVKSSEESSREDKGFDSGKKTNGRKRHILVDTLGLIISLVVHPASIQDRDGATIVFQSTKEAEQLQKIWADGGYAGELVDWVKKTSVGSLRS